MATTTFNQVQGLIDQLTPLEQIRLLEYLTPQIVRNMVKIQPIAATKEADLAEPWQHFFRIGDRLAENDESDAPTFTQAIAAMRR